MGTWNFAYDAVDRLVSATPGGNNPIQYQGKYGCWSYDSFGNRTLEAFSSVACTGTNPTPQAKAVYNQANNRIQSISGTTSASFIYDASGNTLYDGNNYYWYDAEGQLCAVQRAIGGTITQYVYDPEGARIAKGTLASAPSLGATCPSPLSAGFAHTARWLVDQGGDQVTELNGSGVWAHSNIWAGGKLVATYDYNNGKGGIHYELADPLGTKRVQANALGQVDETCTSLPFGNDVNNPIGANCTLVANSLSTGDDATEHHFTGKERDTESGNDYFFARYYASALGRFTTPDWSAKVEPVPYAKLGNPQTLNLYSYVLNNPLSKPDMDGHGCPPDCLDSVYMIWPGSWTSVQFEPGKLVMFGGTTEVSTTTNLGNLQINSTGAANAQLVPGWGQTVDITIHAPGATPSLVSVSGGTPFVSGSVTTNSLTVSPGFVAGPPVRAGLNASVAAGTGTVSSNVTNNLKTAASITGALVGAAAVAASAARGAVAPAPPPPPLPPPPPPPPCSVAGACPK